MGDGRRDLICKHRYTDLGTVCLACYEDVKQKLESANASWRALVEAKLELQAEVERLRGALRGLLFVINPEPGMMSAPRAADVEHARAALYGESEGGGR